ncbi:unnamed protein product [Mesocestoides corti]|uniref:Uncharacterized protein n=1 Tax=Mesocestoides corti TaxID=53468 RepID=A0A0R3UR76_MESCO|nr:unnamed protein product [Mesocestoides corti]
MSEEKGDKVSSWARRNPNGLQPFCPFADDYELSGCLHYNVPPVRLGIEESSSGAVRPPRWHGYTGAKSFFTQQPMPGNSHLLLSGVHAPSHNETNATIDTRRNSNQQKPQDVPCNTVTVASSSDNDIMSTVVRPERHPCQVDVTISPLWRYDGFDHTFQTTRG